MSLNTLFKGRKVKKDIGYNKHVVLKISDIKENLHKYTNGDIAFKNYTVTFINGEVWVYNSLDDIDFIRPLIGLFVK